MADRECRYNHHVICSGSDSCRLCGWYPDEHERRVKALREEVGTVFGSTRNPMSYVHGEERRTAMRKFTGLRRS